MRLLQQIATKQVPLKAKFSPDGAHLLVATVPEPELIYCSISSSRVIRIELGFDICDMAFLTDHLIVLNIMFDDFRDNVLAIYDLTTQQIVSKTAEGGITSVAVDYPRRRIFAGRLDDDSWPYGHIITFDFSLNLQSEFFIPDMPFEIEIADSGDKLAVVGIGFNVWDVTDTPKRISQDHPIEKIECGHSPVCEACSVAITPDGKYAAAGFYGAKGTFLVIDARSGNVIGWYGSETSESKTVAISPDGDFVIVVGLNVPTAKVYRLSDAAITYEFAAQKCRTIAFSPIGDVVALGSGNSIMLYEFAH